jgi:hypothetical protein
MNEAITTGKYVVTTLPLEHWIKPIECDSRQEAEDVCGALRRVCGSKFGASCGWEVLETIRARRSEIRQHRAIMQMMGEAARKVEKLIKVKSRKKP